MLREFPAQPWQSGAARAGAEGAAAAPAPLPRVEGRARVKARRVGGLGAEMPGFAPGKGWGRRGLCVTCNEPTGLSGKGAAGPPAGLDSMGFRGAPAPQPAGRVIVKIWRRAPRRRACRPPRMPGTAPHAWRPLHYVAAAAAACLLAWGAGNRHHGLWPARGRPRRKRRRARPAFCTRCVAAVHPLPCRMQELRSTIGLLKLSPPRGTLRRGRGRRPAGLPQLCGATRTCIPEHP